MSKSVINPKINLVGNETILFIMFKENKSKIFWECPQDNQIYFHKIKPADRFFLFSGEGLSLAASAKEIYSKGKPNIQRYDTLCAQFAKKKQVADECLELKLTKGFAHTLYHRFSSPSVYCSTNIKQSIIDLLGEYNIPHDLSTTSTCTIS